MPKHKLVLVRWGDAWGDGDTVTAETAAKHRVMMTNSVGWLVGENDEGVTIAMDNWDETPDELGGHVSFLPWSWITGYWEIESD